MFLQIMYYILMFFVFDDVWLLYVFGYMGSEVNCVVSY